MEWDVRDLLFPRSGFFESRNLGEWQGPHCKSCKPQSRGRILLVPRIRNCRAAIHFQFVDGDREREVAGVEHGVAGQVVKGLHDKFAVADHKMHVGIQVGGRRRTVAGGGMRLHDAVVEQWWIRRGRPRRCKGYIHSCCLPGC
jgi:hypothetical protein